MLERPPQTQSQVSSLVFLYLRNTDCYTVGRRNLLDLF